MGFGLHVGWAIEGAIGSRFKIDASYLSPHVNMAARLEAATKQFGVTLLLSESFIHLLSPAERRRCRQIDCVTVKGSIQPVGLFTLDIDCSAVSSTADSPPNGILINQNEAEQKQHVVSTAKEDHPVGLSSEDACKSSAAEHQTFSDYPYFDEFEEHPDIVATCSVDDAFLKRFDEGFQLYRAGEWRRAAVVLEETRCARRSRTGDLVIDGPSEALLGVIKENGGSAPAGWAGCRELTEK